MENPWNPFSDYVMNYKARPRCAAILMLVSPQKDMTRAVVARNRPFWKTSNSYPAPAGQQKKNVKT